MGATASRGADLSPGLDANLQDSSPQTFVDLSPQSHPVQVRRHRPGAQRSSGARAAADASRQDFSPFSQQDALFPGDVAESQTPSFAAQHSHSQLRHGRFDQQHAPEAQHADAAAAAPLPPPPPPIAVGLDDARGQHSMAAAQSALSEMRRHGLSVQNIQELVQNMQTLLATLRVHCSHCTYFLLVLLQRLLHCAA